jgi:hypothetical protein
MRRQRNCAVRVEQHDGAPLLPSQRGPGPHCGRQHGLFRPVSIRDDRLDHGHQRGPGAADLGLVRDQRPQPQSGDVLRGQATRRPHQAGAPGGPRRDGGSVGHELGMAGAVVASRIMGRVCAGPETSQGHSRRGLLKSTELVVCTYCNVSRTEY